MIKLVLLRHGESLWNRENRFSGWTDVDLTGQGIDEAMKAGMLLKNAGFVFDVCFTSVLKRAIRTLWIVLDQMDLMWVPVQCSWRLNERHYGALQGLNKFDTAQKYGDEQVRIWRRSYDGCPPPLDRRDARYSGHDLRYRHLAEEDIPLAESLKDTEKRFLPYWHETIIHEIQYGRRVMITAHGNSLRALVKHLDRLAPEEIVTVEIPTGIPLVYELDDAMNVLRHYYLGNPETGG